MSPTVSVTGAAPETPTLAPSRPSRTPPWLEGILPAAGLNLIFYCDFPPLLPLLPSRPTQGVSNGYGYRDSLLPEQPGNKGSEEMTFGVPQPEFPWATGTGVPCAVPGRQA